MVTQMRILGNLYADIVDLFEHLDIMELLKLLTDENSLYQGVLLKMNLMVRLGKKRKDITQLIEFFLQLLC
jgi:hypothetical protein